MEMTVFEFLYHDMLGLEIRGLRSDPIGYKYACSVEEACMAGAMRNEIAVVLLHRIDGGFFARLA